MRKRFFYIVNFITFYRMLAAPVLLYLIFTHQPGIFKWLLAISFFTDAIDGYLARKYQVVSSLGSTIDSIADDLTVLAAIVGIYIFKPDFLKQEIVLGSLLVILYLVQNAYAWLKYGKMTSFHTYTAKIAAVLQGIFLILFHFFNDPIVLLFYIAAIATLIDLVEEIALIFILPVWKTDVKGLYWVIKNKVYRQLK
ncbi:CDP-alcohol phosphatidyltransferase family protein [Mucilaginibacter lacusdianchii]|uniref:CDP-alcohol phosphatidyltransferase family protein n=1 Tax=Mucilaginibacter lacusdianchii TaxID=2684211 RepID=UPI00131C848E|nr:CDP-alcohol phosphatidyltransferase family protein [Mucilaginibacter sp. JXJ CY 39]